MNKPRLDEILCGILLAAMALIAFINILGRYLFHYSLSFTEEICLNFFVYMTILGSGIVFEKNAHPSFLSLFNHFPSSVKRFFIRLNSLLAVALFVIINVYIIKIAYDEITVYHSTSSALGIQVWIYYLPVPFLSIFVLLRIYNGLKKALAAIPSGDKYGGK